MCVLKNNWMDKSITETHIKYLMSSKTLYMTRQKFSKLSKGMNVWRLSMQHPKNLFGQKGIKRKKISISWCKIIYVINQNFATKGVREKKSTYIYFQLDGEKNCQKEKLNFAAKKWAYQFNAHIITRSSYVFLIYLRSTRRC